MNMGESMVHWQFEIYSDRQAECVVLERILDPEHACVVRIVLPQIAVNACQPYFDVRSAIIFPKDKSVIVHEGKIQLKGWAYSGGGNWVQRVEVSPDG